ncbi:hypothetical protein PAXRUDRAFT_806929 [Paxillus rubicundulus Ve08.2h10]|uniref:Uncharacterized protein n=1 Tax=Paxillus rubicundulus Ve08.2h10 TaxID=930991 RepID=A0A0D0DQQ8_9AGAM|nr:hypothetical protein PAXRUDRAFT_806929 [Paxillus rubicundulus Ve08.2h10]
MMMTICADILEMQIQGRKSDAERFINSNEFKLTMTIIYKDILKDQLWACLLSLDLTAYVQDLAVQIFIYAKNNLQTFKILGATLEDSEMTEKITAIISQLLMSARLNMKQKTTNHIDSKSQISVLARLLAPGGGYEITTTHWACIAFLCDSMMLFKSVVEESSTCTTAQKKHAKSNLRQP